MTSINWGKAITLPKEVSIYVPSHQQDGAEIGSKPALVRFTLDRLAEVCGGATAYKARGAYKAEDGRLLVDGVTVVRAFYSDDPALETRVIEAAGDIVAHILVEGNQESVGLELGGRFRLVFADALEAPAPVLEWLPLRAA